MRNISWIYKHKPVLDRLLTKKTHTVLTLTLLGREGKTATEENLKKSKSCCVCIQVKCGPQSFVQSHIFFSIQRFARYVENIELHARFKTNTTNLVNKGKISRSQNTFVRVTLFQMYIKENSSQVTKANETAYRNNGKFIKNKKNPFLSSAPIQANEPLRDSLLGI